MSRRVGVFAIAASVALAVAGLGLLISGATGPVATVIDATVIDPIDTDPPDTDPAEADPTDTDPDEADPTDTVPDPDESPTVVPALSVVAAPTSVGAGGMIVFSGVCPVVDAAPLGPVHVRITNPAGESVVVVTDLVAATWTFEWTAPTDPTAFGPHRFELWCGDPTGSSETAPSITIDIVAVGMPPIPPTVPTTIPLTVPTTIPTTVPVVDQAPPVPGPVTLPETG